jgi:hypothetical protein
VQGVSFDLFVSQRPVVAPHVLHWLASVHVIEAHLLTHSCSQLHVPSSATAMWQLALVALGTSQRPVVGPHVKQALSPVHVTPAQDGAPQAPAPAQFPAALVL